MTDQLVEAGEDAGHVVGQPIAEGMVWLPLDGGTELVAMVLMPPGPFRDYGRGSGQPEIFEAVLPDDFIGWPGPVPVDLRADPSMYWLPIAVGLRIETADGRRDVSCKPLDGPLRIPKLLPSYPPRGVVTDSPGYVGEYELEPLTPIGLLFGPAEGSSVLWGDSSGGERGWGTYAPGILAHRHSAVANEGLMVVGQRVVGYREISVLQAMQPALLQSRYHGVVANF